MRVRLRVIRRRRARRRRAHGHRRWRARVVASSAPGVRVSRRRTVHARARGDLMRARKSSRPMMRRPCIYTHNFRVLIRRTRGRRDLPAHVLYDVSLLCYV